MSNHLCKTNFWDQPAPLNAADVLIEWLNWLDSIPTPPTAPHPARTMQPATWATLCLVQFEVERATGFPHAFIPPYSGGGDFLDENEADFRATMQVFLALLVADQWDPSPPDNHSHSKWAWIHTSSAPPAPGSPEPAGMVMLTGDVQPPTADPASLLGRIRNALDSSG